MCVEHISTASAEAGLGAPQMVVMSDVDDPFVPLPDDLLVNLRESRAVFEGLLDAIPATFAANSQVAGRLL
jgi:protein transport protein SEC24